MLGMLAAPAAAHVELVATDPADGSLLEAPPSAMVIAFSGDLQAGAGSVQVVAADGTDIASGPPVIEGPRAEVGLSADAAPGDYTVSYALVAADGHETTGEFAFTITAPAAAPTPTATPTEDEHAGHAPTPPPTTTAPPSPQVTAPTEVAAAPAVASPAPDEPSDAPALIIALAVVLALGAGVLYLLNRRTPVGAPHSE